MKVLLIISIALLATIAMFVVSMIWGQVSFKRWREWMREDSAFPIFMIAWIIIAFVWSAGITYIIMK